MSGKLYYTIGEVAEQLGVPTSKVRYWTENFDCVSPHRNKKGNRMYTDEDIERLRNVRYLTAQKGMKLKTANEILNSELPTDDVSVKAEAISRLEEIRNELATIAKYL